MTAIISDVHGNLEALQAVLDDIGPDRTVFCAGDCVGYGPNPNECCELLRERGVHCVKGNHDHVCATMEDVEPCNPLARASFHWTHARLSDDNREWLHALPLQLNMNGLSLVHGAPGTPREMLNTYVLDRYYNGERYEALLRRVPGKRLVVGHTHVPHSYGYNGRVVNPGSVGQPRDGDWRASYVTLEDMRYKFSLVLDPRASFSMLKDKVVFHRVKYDCRSTVAKLEAEPDMPPQLANILQHGGLKF